MTLSRFAPLAIALVACSSAPDASAPESAATLPVDQAGITPTIVLSTTSRFVPGELVTVSLSNVPPNRNVFLLGSLRSSGTLACPLQLAPECLDLFNPISLAGQATSDANGDATITLRVPRAAPFGFTGYLQAAMRVGTQPFGSNVLEVTFVPPIPTATIPDIRNGLAVAEGELVTATDLVVTAVGPNGFTAEDATGAPKSGIYVYTAGTNLPAVGDVVIVTGEYDEYSGSGGTPPFQTISELVATDTTPGAAITVIGTAPVPAPLPVTLDDIAIPNLAEDFESRAVVLAQNPPTLLDVLTDPTFSFGEFDVGASDTLTTAVIDNEFFSLPNNVPDFGVGGTFSSITGIVYYSFGTTKIAPRGLADGADYVAPPVDTDTDTDVPTAPAVWITEVVDYGPVAALKYVEIYNGTGASYDLAELAVLRYANGSTTPGVVPLSGTVAPGDVYVVGATTTSDYLGNFGDVPDITSGTISGNGDDVYALGLADGLGGYIVFDTYGVIGVDGTGEPWEYTDSVANRTCAAAAPTATFDPADWTISTDFTNNASLGVPPVCP